MSQNEESCSSTSNGGISESELSSFQQITPPQNSQGKDYNCREGVRKLQFSARALTPPPETNNQQSVLQSFLSIPSNTPLRTANSNHTTPKSSSRRRKANKSTKEEAPTPEKCPRSTTTDGNNGTEKVSVHHNNGVQIYDSVVTVNLTQNFYPNVVSEKEPLSKATCSAESNGNTSPQEKCTLCLTRNPNMKFLPCGHCCVCNCCATSVKTCPTCRSNIEQAILDLH